MELVDAFCFCIRIESIETMTLYPADLNQKNTPTSTE
jgi:hypothetical protein